jgi:hypothetical protein
VTDNELARKTIELTDANSQLAKWYENLRERANFSVFYGNEPECTGLMLPPRLSSSRNRPPEWKEVLDIDPARCLARGFDSNALVAQLNTRDREFLRQKLEVTVKQITEWQVAARTQCDALADAPASSIPPQPEMEPVAGSPEASLKDYLVAKGRWTYTPEGRRLQAQNAVVDDLAQRMRDRLLELAKTKMPKLDAENP